MQLDINDFDQILKTTRSVRRRLDFERPVPQGLIQDCIEVAIQAPVSGTGENWRFLVVTDPRKKQAIADCYRSALLALMETRGVAMKSSQQALVDRLHEMPCLILVFALGSPGDTIPEQVAYFGSILPAAWSLMIALRARGLGSTWTTLLSRESETVGRLLGIPQNVTQTVMLPVGYTRDAVLKPADRNPDVIYWNRWQGERDS